MLFYIGIALMGYLLGSIPFGLVITRMAGLGDIRKIGSGNIGATNVLRTGRRDLAFATLLFDLFKAGLAAMIAMMLADQDKALASLVAGTCGVFGHNFPVWLKFKGGKGVASTIGMMLVTSFPTGLCVGVTWLVVAFISRYSSLSALVAIGLSPLYGYLFEGDADFSVFYGLLAVLCFYRHRTNIVRLLSGTEGKINLRKQK